MVLNGEKASLTPLDVNGQALGTLRYSR